MPTFVLQNDGEKPPHSEPPFLTDVNDAQKKAVLHTDGPLLIIAGAGSGKTRVLTYRIANLLYQKKAWPNQILALTFTNKAAREMQERIVDLIGEKANRIWMGTFHSIFSRILRFEAEHLGYTRDFSIYDTVDTDRVIKSILQELGFNTREVKPQAVRFIISNAKNQLISPEAFKNKFVQSSLDDIAAQVYERYIARCRQNNAMDFDDLLIKPIELFEHHPEILQKYQNHFRYILIDEYQDTNHAQYRATQLLAAGHQNICVVGDDSQSIYSFRGADISNILNFKEDYPDSAQIPLEQNYRSTKSILQCADSVIRQNTSRLDKTLWTQNDRGEIITVLENYDERDEANRIVRSIEDLKMREHLSFRDFAVLYRTNYQSRVLEDAFRRRGVPYQLVGGISFYQRKEIKDVTAYLRLLVNPHDDESLLRVINEPARGVGEKTITNLQQIARKHNKSLWDTIGDVESTGIYKPAIGRIRDFVDILERTGKKLTDTGLTDTVRFLLDETGYVKQFVEEHSHDSLMRRQNVMELLNAISYFEKSSNTPSLSAFLQEISLVTDLDAHDTDDPAVTLMTVHGSKGLEFPVVFITGLEEDLFPIGGRSGEDVDIEEERRLFYVAITRAEKRLYFSYAKNRFRFGEQVDMNRSRFLDEVDPSVVRTETGATIRQTGSPGMAGRSGKSGTYISYDQSNYDGNAGAGSDFHSESYDSAAPADDGGGMGVEYDQNTGEIIWRSGMAVIHKKFGPGKIVQCQGQGDDARLTVFFKNVGQKKLVARLAQLKVIG
ncbi:ATP-dependent helicase [Natronogracilivirga saccharolytica]|uniref:DNA 3'-5' helicase n=1 Tax=Natronogracilivirga saccharolytica TaxID=2812953 RepID=A0A8J7RKI0_9BACT|nr:UvrD-helicase domain-containing protein [Natronogracilivirga saccharolytica]MBP3192495.1 UvrD-helicase domain-containing protein [Natronogracilivirga saccharolytica]